MVKCVCVYMGLKSNGCFVTNAWVGHYTTYIISSVGHPRSNSVRLLVLWMVAYNDQGTNILLQVTWDGANPVENE